jgi:hypothetical protein
LAMSSERYLFRSLGDADTQPFVNTAEKLKNTYKLALSEYEQKKEGTESREGAQPSRKKDSNAPVAEPGRSKPSPAKGGFTAVQAPPLDVNPEQGASEDDSEDEAAVAADLGGTHPPASVSPSKRKRKETTHTNEGKKEKKDKSKEKEKDKERKKRRKSNKGDA